MKKYILLKNIYGGIKGIEVSSTNNGLLHFKNPDVKGFFINILYLDWLLENNYLKEVE